MSKLGALLPELQRQFEDLASRFMASDNGQRLLAWHDQLSPRDRLALRVLSWFAAALLLYAMLLQPVFEFGDRAQSRLQQERALVAWLEANRAVAGQTAKTATVVREQPVAVLVNASAVQSKLAIESIKPAGDDGIRVELKGVAFNAIVKWLHLMEAEGIHAEAFNIGHRPGEAGMVDATLTLRG
jgi:general secretion pathway protein M